jgi:cytochrome P450
MLHHEALRDVDAGASHLRAQSKRLRARFGRWSRLERSRSRVDALLLEEIAARRAGQAEAEDILGLLLAARYEDGSSLSDRQIRDELVTLMVAGHEGTAIALSWAVYRLCWHPDVLARLRAELESVPGPEAWAELPFLGAVCSETLRLYPMIPEVARRLCGPFPFMGYELPAGVSIVVAKTLVHARSDPYPSPEPFRPERFLERSVSPFEFVAFEN